MSYSLQLERRTAEAEAFCTEVVLGGVHLAGTLAFSPLHACLLDIRGLVPPCSFGIQHDGKENDCESARRQPYIMSRQLQYNPIPLTWSKCSKEYITRFLE